MYLRFRKTPSIKKETRDKMLAELEKKIEKNPDDREKLIDEHEKLDPRATYKQRDDNGKVIATIHLLKDADALGITIFQAAAMLDQLHKIDDEEVERNLYEFKPHGEDLKKREEERERFRKEFIEEHGYEPHAKDLPSKFVSVICSEDPNTIIENEVDISGDFSLYKEVMEAPPFKSLECSVDDLHEIVETVFTPKERAVYKILFNDQGEKKQPNRIAAKQLNISEVRVGQIMKNIIEKLTANLGLKKRFRF